MLAQISSDTVVSLTMSQLITVVIFLLSLLVSLVTGSRYLERYRIQLNQNQTDIAQLLQVTRGQQEQINELAEQIRTLVRLMEPSSKRISRNPHNNNG